MFRQGVPYTRDALVMLGSGSQIPITHVRHTTLNFHLHKLQLRGLLYASQVEKNLVLVKQLYEDNHVRMEFFPNTLCV